MDPNDPALREAQRRMAGVARSLVRRFGAATAISILAGPIAAIAGQAFGLEGHEYLHRLADEMEDGDERPLPPSTTPTVN
jgi:hypothetical protein